MQKYKVDLTNSVSGHQMRELLEILPQLVFKQRKQYDEYHFQHWETPRIELTIDLIKSLTEKCYYPTIYQDSIDINTN